MPAQAYCIQTRQPIKPSHVAAIREVHALLACSPCEESLTLAAVVLLAELPTTRQVQALCQAVVLQDEDEAARPAKNL